MSMKMAMSPLLKSIWFLIIKVKNIDGQRPQARLHFRLGLPDIATICSRLVTDGMERVEPETVV